MKILDSHNVFYHLDTLCMISLISFVYWVVRWCWLWSLFLLSTPLHGNVLWQVLFSLSAWKLEFKLVLVCLELAKFGSKGKGVESSWKSKSSLETKLMFFCAKKKRERGPVTKRKGADVRWCPHCHAWFIILFVFN